MAVFYPLRLSLRTAFYFGQTFFAVLVQTAAALNAVYFETVAAECARCILGSLLPRQAFLPGIQWTVGNAGR
jgi:hypothetical protein